MALKKILCFIITGLGTGNFPTPPPQPLRPKCEANTCFRGVRCTDTTDGFQCGPCPEGFTGNGVICTDIDEVKCYLFVFLRDTFQHFGGGGRVNVSFR